VVSAKSGVSPALSRSCKADKAEPDRLATVHGQEALEEERLVRQALAAAVDPPQEGAELRGPGGRAGEASCASMVR
jgi:hypothetical protein